MGPDHWVRFKPFRQGGKRRVCLDASRSVAGIAGQWRWLGLLLALGMSAPVLAADLLTSEVAHRDGRFTVHAEVLVAVATPRVRALLGQYHHLPKLNDGIRTVTLLDPDARGRTRMAVDSQLCVLLFCLDYHWVQRVETLPSGDILSTMEPDLSDFREGTVRYSLRSAGGATRLTTRAVLVPDFWFPPGVGSWLIKRKLREEVLETARGIERLAAESPP